MPEVPRFAMYSGCVLDQLSWQLQRSGLLTATAKLVAQGETVATTTADGAPAEVALKRIGHFNGGRHPQRRRARQRRLGRDHLRQQPRPHRDHPERRPHRRRRPVDRRAHRPGRGALRRSGAGQPSDRRRPVRARVRLQPCPRARASPSRCTRSTCHGRGSRSRDRRACRRPSTGRRRGTQPLCDRGGAPRGRRMPTSPGVNAEAPCRRHQSSRSIDFQACVPNVESVSLVVAWFGDDLRAGHCRIRPGVEVSAKSTTPANWSVNGVGRGRGAPRQPRCPRTARPMAARRPTAR